MSELRELGFDLETIGDKTIVPFLPAVEANKTYKDPFKIKEDIESKKLKQLEGLGLRPGTNIICCASFIDMQTDAVTSLVLTPDLDEKKLLQDIWEIMHPYDRFISFNGNKFDVPVLRFHSMLHKVPMPVKLSTSKYHRGNHIDLRNELNDGDEFAKGDFDFYCKRLGGTGKTVMESGAEVQGYWDAGRIDEIVAYNQEDVKNLAFLYRRMKGYFDF
jgi:predicted PolB exonuclease-like 3'-5' exonuclease